MPPFNPHKDLGSVQHQFDDADKKIFPEGSSLEPVRRTPEGILYSLLPDAHPIIQEMVKNPEITSAQGGSYYKIIRELRDYCGGFGDNDSFEVMFSNETGVLTLVVSGDLVVDISSEGQVVVQVGNNERLVVDIGRGSGPYKVTHNAEFSVDDVLTVEAVRKAVRSDTRKIGSDYVIDMLNQGGHLSGLLLEAKDISNYFELEIKKQSFKLLEVKFAAKFALTKDSYTTADSVRNFFIENNISSGIHVGTDEFVELNDDNDVRAQSENFGSHAYNNVHIYIGELASPLSMPLKMSQEEYAKLKSIYG